MSKLDPDDIEFLAVAFKALKEQIKVASIAAAQAAHGAAIALRVLGGLVDKETLNKATEEIGIEAGKALAKAQKSATLSPSEAFERYGGM